MEGGRKKKTVARSPFIPAVLRGRISRSREKSLRILSGIDPASLRPLPRSSPASAPAPLGPAVPLFFSRRAVRRRTRVTNAPADCGNFRETGENVDGVPFN